MEEKEEPSKDDPGCIIVLALLIASAIVAAYLFGSEYGVQAEYDDICEAACRHDGAIRVAANSVDKECICLNNRTTYRYGPNWVLRRAE